MWWLGLRPNHHIYEILSGTKAPLITLPEPPPAQPRAHAAAGPPVVLCGLPARNPRILAFRTRQAYGEEGISVGVWAPPTPLRISHYTPHRGFLNTLGRGFI